MFSAFKRLFGHSPLLVVAVATVVTTLLLVFLGWRERFFARELDPRVELVESKAGADAGADYAGDRTPFAGEVYDTEERLLDASALAVAGVVLVAESPTLESGQLARVLSTRQLLPEGMSLVDGQLRSAQGIFQLRCERLHLAEEEVTGLEVVSVPAGRAQGPGLLLRIPGSLDDGAVLKRGFVYWQAGTLEELQLPAPFASPAELYRLGWEAKVWAPRDQAVNQ